MTDFYLHGNCDRTTQKRVGRLDDPYHPELVGQKTASFSSVMEDTINICTGFNWTPRLIVQSAMGSRIIQHTYSSNTRGNLGETPGELVSPENVVWRMIACQKDLDAMNFMITMIQSQL